MEQLLLYTAFFSETYKDFLHRFSSSFVNKATKFRIKLVQQSARVWNHYAVADPGFPVGGGGGRQPIGGGGGR